MPKYMFQANYTLEGVKGLAKDGGSKRREAVDAAFKSLGGKLEAFYYTFGDPDVVVIADMPDNMSAAAASVAINSSGAVTIKTTVLLSLEEMDAATKKTVNYRRPGQ